MKLKSGNDANNYRPANIAAQAAKAQASAADDGTEGNAF